MNEIAWPCFVFAHDGWGNACHSLEELASVDEPLSWDDMVVFDSCFRQVQLLEPQRPNPRTPDVGSISSEPRADVFADLARESLRLYGPGARWGIFRRRRESDLDTSGIDAHGLAALVREHLAVR